MLFDEAENATEGIGGVFVVADGDGFDAHLDDRIIVAARLSHVAEVKDIFFANFELLEEVSHAEDFVHTGSNGVDGCSATNFVIKFGGELFAALDDCFAFLAIWIPSVFGFGASFLAESREGDLAEAVFDNFVTFSDFVLLPVAKFFGGRFDSFGDFLDLSVGKRIVVNLLPIFFLGIVAIVLCTLSNEEMEMF